MRELKFKAFYKPTKTMYWFDVMNGNHGHGNGYVGMAPFGEDIDKPNGGYRSNMILVDPTDCELMQFTGLTDKNGKEIYEGDIVKCGYGVAKVIFNAGCFMIEWLDDREAYMEFVFSRKGMYSRQNDDEKLEIIGNIYENPELI